MRRDWRILLGISMLCALGCSVEAQEPQEIPPSNVIRKPVTAIGYTVGKGTKVDLEGTDVMPRGNGEAKVEARKGITTVEAEIQNMAQPSTLGTELLTYVVWAVSPEGRSNNLGEIIVNKEGEGKLNATTPFQTFSLFVTAEPYFAVRRPSEFVVLKNQLKKGTKGKIFTVNDYPLMRRNQYEKMGNPLALTVDTKSVPLEMYEARNAVDIARTREAGKYAPEIFSKAVGSLEVAENSLARKEDKKVIISNARQTVQFSEDARQLTEQRKEEERIAKEKADAAESARAEAENKAAAEAAETKRRSDLEAQRQAELAAAKQAALRAEADNAALKAKAQQAAIRAEAENAAIRAKAEQDALKAREASAQADADRSRRAAEALRAQLLEQFNRVLETRDTPRGLVVNMGDVLFASGKYDLAPEAQILLAKLAGIILSHPGLHLGIEGYTDNVGSDDFNLKLSQQRADTVRQYLINQGLPDNTVTASGLGKANFVDSNETPAGRKKNRRVEIVVSGEIIGQKVGT